MNGIASLGCTVAEARDTNWEGGGICRGSLGGGTGIVSGVCRPRNHCPRYVMKELRRLSASKPMSMASRRNGSDIWSKPGALTGRGVAQNVGIGRCRKLLHTVIRKTVEEESERVALLKVEHPRGGS